MNPSPAFHEPDAPPSALIDTCVHCGFCLPTCPTYLLWGEEMDSPRGRVYLMKAGVDGRAELSSSFVQHFDRCLGCVACVTACPSGVQYGPLIEKTRAQIERRYTRSLPDRLFRSGLMALVPYPQRMRIAMLPLVLLGGIVRAIGRRLMVPGKRVSDEQNGGARQALPSADATFMQRVAAALALSPPVSLFSMFRQIPEHTPAVGESRLKVAVLTGCVQRLSFGDVNRATVNVLAAEGCTVAAPATQGCCGALPLHAGGIEQARRLARHNIEVFEAAGVERIVVNAAGCGSAMKEYKDLLAADPEWAARAHEFSAKVRDISELLIELGDPVAPRNPIHARVAYHDACHLAHGQGIRAQPRALLQTIPGLELVTPAESEICCGSAGIYNLVQPEPAAQLGARKAKNIAVLSPDLIATANPGCTLQISAAARVLGYKWPVFHPIQLVDASIQGRRLKGLRPKA
ncbi:MAG TPA: heterodisulfide reductase-related iron-sulfur binding cluster [Vicinamibacterales bacterium]|nr:heterodisulfide reductase-related iron-sulfur binding cluster [Vicinamibacterales bacterium]